MSSSSSIAKVIVRESSVPGQYGLFANVDIPALSCVLTELPYFHVSGATTIENDVNLLLAKCNGSVDAALEVFGDKLPQSVPASHPLVDQLVAKQKTNQEKYALLVGKYQAYHYGLVTSLGCCPYGSALFTGNMASINHSCEPNCQYNFVINPLKSNNSHRLPEVQVFAARDIAQGEEITVSYVVDIYGSKASRQQILRNLFSFSCHCTRCQRKEAEEKEKPKETNITPDAFTCWWMMQVATRLKDCIDEDSKTTNSYRDQIKYGFELLKCFVTGSRRQNDIEQWKQLPVFLQESIATVDKIGRSLTSCPFENLSELITFEKLCTLFDWICNSLGNQVRTSTYAAFAVVLYHGNKSRAWLNERLQVVFHASTENASTILSPFIIGELCSPLCVYKSTMLKLLGE